jgi:hypothetical protein
MALKDWKKNKKEKLTWHKENPKSWQFWTIQVYSTAGLYIAKSRKELQGWIVEISGSDISTTSKQFKTKIQALAYAKKYMRSH